MSKDILAALIYIFGALVALWIMYFQIKRELRRIVEHGIHKSIGLMVKEDDIREIADLVLDEIGRRKRNGEEE